MPWYARNSVRRLNPEATAGQLESEPEMEDISPTGT